MNSDITFYQIYDIIYYLTYYLTYGLRYIIQYCVTYIITYGLNILYFNWFQPWTKLLSNRKYNQFVSIMEIYLDILSNI